MLKVFFMHCGLVMLRACHSLWMMVCMPCSFSVGLSNALVTVGSAVLSQQSVQVAFMPMMTIVATRVSLGHLRCQSNWLLLQLH